MSGSSDEILHALAQHDAPGHTRTTLNLLFTNCDTLQTDHILGQLRTAHYAPRGQAFHNLNELQQLLSRHSWDILIMRWQPDQTSDLSPTAVLECLNHMDRDLPVILLLPGDHYPYPTEWFASGVRALVPEHNGHLLLLSLERAFQGLTTRRELAIARLQLKQLQERCERLMATSSQAACLVRNGRVHYANPPFTRLFGYRRDGQLQGHSLAGLFPENQRPDLEQCLYRCAQEQTSVQHHLSALRPDGTCFKALFTIMPDTFPDASGFHLAVTTEPGTEQATNSHRHPVSGLHDQQRLMEALDSACQTAHRGGEDRSLLLLNLDHLEVIQHEVGPDGTRQILGDIATLLKREVGPAHLIAQLNDDRFAVLMHCAAPDQAEALAERLCQSVSRHICEVGSTSIHTTLSIGIVMINDSAPDAQTLLQRAQAAAEHLHHGNRPGNGVSLYHKNTLLPAEQDARMGKRLRNALRLNRFRLLFQPVVPLCLEPPQPYYEVLMRLISDSERALSPTAFVAQGIAADVLVEMDQWVINTALTQLAEHTRAQHPVFLLINLCGASLGHLGLLAWLQARLAEHATPPQQLIFQISESDAAVNLMGARSFTRQLRQLGCRVCLKHFGSSPNSEHVLRELETDYIKLDGSYIQDLEKRRLKPETLLEVLHPLQQHDKLIIAPLVESTRVISTLYGAGVHLIQGYYLQQPREQMDYDFFGEGPL
ncbi:EAL domain-containing protein [Marinobacterium weihaiense]|uniref:EAL domain-containing protein n=1 Tax=Marinobacterium weihaiense TaxID=2851016 RepID=A0ABS6M8D7_9GAMM|nr:EAL domain-containing protein [Marinobacterium weihaiense]MBV0932549.1 EAL domain-containing protein [Marinobacterium weihaiense]